jgi:hypothetical protein
MKRKLIMIIEKLKTVNDTMLAGEVMHSTCIQPLPCIKTKNSSVLNVSFYEVRLAGTLN